MKRWLIALLVLAAPVAAVLPDEQLADPVMEARARAISQQLRCVVCQNQSIDESDAPLARDLRVIVREQLRIGKTDAQTMDYLVQRYGNYVLLKPPFNAATLLLWLGPLFVVLAGGAGIWFWLRGRRPAAADALSPADEARVAQLLREDPY